MGKFGKAAKRARLALEAASTAPLQSSSTVDDRLEAAGLTPAELQLTTRVLHCLGSHLELFASPTCKALRVALAPLLQAQLAKGASVPSFGGPAPASTAAITSGANSSSSAATAASAAAVAVGKPSGLVGRVGDALRYGRWAEAVSLLQQLRAAGIVPKLGSVQRWVRDTDACREHTPGPRWLALSEIVRACAPRGAGGAGSSSGGSGSGSNGRLGSARGEHLKEHLAPSTAAVGAPTTHGYDGLAPATAASSSGDSAAAAPSGGLHPMPHAPLASPVQLLRFPPFRPQFKAHTHAAVAPTASPAPQFKAHTHTSGALPFPGAPASSSSSNAAGEVNGSSGSGDLRSRFSVVSHTPAAARLPPNRYDQTIYAGRAVSLCREQGARVQATPVPFVPGAVMLGHALSHSECDAIVAAADALGWVPDEVLAVGGGYDDDSGGGSGDELRAGNVVWLADDEFISTLFARLGPHLPQQLRGDAIAGINARCRLYRYGTDALYRPHLDGAWPGSGMVDGTYAYDAFSGAIWSRLTVVIYLNDDFEGGCTTFYLPPDPGAAADAAGAGGEAASLPGAAVCVHGVAPQKGAVLVFPHGEHPHPEDGVAGGFLVHEGSVVKAGSKLILRTDVLYKTRSIAGRQAAAPLGK